jgi:regulator of RNase E activity RraA
MDSNVARAARLDTATISDALDRLQIAGQCLGIKPRRAVQMAGRAFTVRYGSIDVAAPGTVGDYIDDVAPGTVVVLDNGGREDMTVWGGILTLLAHRKAIAGTVIDGACRDTRVSAELGYPLFSRSYSMRTGKGRVQVDAVQTPVTIGGARVQPQDIVRGDCDGVVVIPGAREVEVLAIAEEIEHAEQGIRDLIEAGKRLDEARMLLRYHSLQSPPRTEGDK